MPRASVKIILENLEQCPRDSRRRHNKPGRIERGETAERLIREEGRERLVSKHIGYIPRDLSRDNWQICREEAGRGRLETTRRVSRDKRAGNIVSPPLLNFKFSPPPPPTSLVKPRFLATRGGRREDFWGILREEYERRSFASFVRWSPFYFCLPPNRFFQLVSEDSSDARKLADSDLNPRRIRHLDKG